MNSDASRNSGRAWLVAASAVVVASVIVTFEHLGADACRPGPERGIIARAWCGLLEGHSVCRDSEGNTALIVQDMVERGNFLFPMMNGQVPMRKPPLTSWLTAAYLATMGQGVVTPFALRAQAAAAGVLTVVLVIGFGWRLLGPRGGVLAGLILTAWYQFIARARLARVDSLLTFFDTLAVFTLVGWLKFEEAPEQSREARKRVVYHYLFALALGLAVITKGPIGVALPGLAVLVWIGVERRWQTLRRLCAPGPLIAGAVIALSWYAVCAWYGRWDFLREELVKENVTRFVGGMGVGRMMYYLWPVVADSWPLGMLAFMIVAYALFAGSPRDSSESRDRFALDAVRLFSIYFAVTIAVLSLAAFKQRSYLMPLWPISAVMISWWIERKRDRRFGPWIAPSAFATCVALVVFNYFMIRHVEALECSDRDYPHAAAEITRLIDPRAPLYSRGFSGGINGSLAPLVFYLRRNAPPYRGPLEQAPPGYMILRTMREVSAAKMPPGVAIVGSASWGRGKVLVLRRDAPAKPN
ncbi:MAG: ArnT family glycosyltransferase [Candidatus Binataceae bacterium]